MYNDTICQMKGVLVMYLAKNALLKIGDTYWYGILKGFDFERQHPITEDNVNDDQKSMTIEHYFAINNIDSRFAEAIKKMYNASDIWIMKPSATKDDRKYWRKRNEKCLMCTEKCKQSIVVDVYHCKEYKAKEKKKK